MNYLEQINLNEPAVVITTAENKYNLITKANEVEGFIQLQIFSFNEVNTILNGEISPSAILKTCEFYQQKYQQKLNVAVAKKYLNELDRIDILVDYDEQILNFLKELKQHLIAEQLLIISPYQSQLITGKNVYLYDVPVTKKFKDKLEELAPKTIQEIKLTAKYQPKLYVFNNYNEEVDFVANEIASLIDSGVDINKIAIHIPASDYYSQVRITFANYNLNLKPLKTRYLNSYQFVNDLLEEIEIKKDLLFLEDLPITNSQDQELCNQVIAILNKYPEYHHDVSKLLEVVKYDLANTEIKTDNITNVIREINPLKYAPALDEHIFILNCAEQKVPKLIKDTRIMSDLQAEKYGEAKSYEENQLHKGLLINKFGTIHNLTLTFAKTTPTGEDSLASILSAMNVTECDRKLSSIRYSKVADTIALAKAKELNNKFGTKAPELRRYQNLDLPENFNNQINSELPRDLKKPLRLSPTAIEKFFKCEFKFYVEQILQIRPQVGDMTMLKLGNLFHFVMENALKFKKTTAAEIKTLICHYNDQENLKLQSVFIDKYTSYLTEIVAQTTAFHNNHDFELTDESFEKEVKMVLDKTNNIELVGKIDKFLELDLDDKYYVAIIDYKTKNKPNIDHQLFHHGLDLQNIVYFYLLKHDRLDDDFELIGTFQHRIKPQNKITSEAFKDDFKLFGYATSNEEKLRQFEPNYEDGNLSKLANVRVSKSGFYKSSKVADEEAINEFIQIVDDKLKAVTAAINANRYEINPKRLDKKDISCENCYLRPICLRMNDNYVEISKEEDAED